MLAKIMKMTKKKSIVIVQSENKMKNGKNCKLNTTELNPMGNLVQQKGKTNRILSKGMLSRRDRVLSLE